MAIILKGRSFQKNMFLSIGGIFVVFAICFSIYQYKREKEYKIDIMHSRLQMYNYEMMQTLGKKGILKESLFRNYMKRHNIEGIRVTIIDKKGRVLLDNGYSSVDSLSNHLERTEVRQALHHGNGYDIKRTSLSTHGTYFYSATRFGDIILRSAVPYSSRLTHSLQADNSYLYFALALTALLGIALYWSTHRISRHIGYLREFAMKAGEEQELDHELERQLPDDELGEISHTIITLYWQLRHSEEEKVRIKRQLTQNAAHELKTPAASIHGFLESILENPDMPAEKRQHFLERCYAQSERMSKLLLDMSALTKLDEMGEDAQKRTANFTQIDVAAILNNVLEDTALQLQEKGLTLMLNVPEKVKISGDASLVYGIFRNLIDNAIAYAIGATWLKIICIEVEEGEQKSFEFIVSDNGQGIDLQNIPHLFKRFYRIDKGRSRKLGGTGLGLAIVKNSVAVHGGTATAEPTPGGGLTIRFTLNTK